jgi:Transposase DDE domain
LLDVCSRRIARFRFLHWRRSEHNATSSLVAGLGSGELLLADRGLYSFPLMMQLLGQKASFLFRLPKNRVVKKKKWKGPGDWIGWICCRVPKDEIPSLPSLKVDSVGKKYAQVRLKVRIIEYRIADGSSNFLVTDLLETEAIPALELVRLYHRRWDIELAYDEVKIHLSHPPAGAVKTILRSKSPRLVIQEVYALLIAYNLVRTTILESAELHNLPPEDLSFVGALKAIELAMPHLVSASNAYELQRNYRRLLEDIAQCHNLRPRRKRKYDRVVRRNQGRFSVKRSYHREQRIDFENSIFFAEAA